MTTWLDRPAGSMSRAARLRRLIEGRTTVAVPGAHDGISARLARRAGFEALYLSGAALSASMALPDLGLITLEDVSARAREIVRAADLPLVVDCDTGFGEALNVMHTVRRLEEAGADVVFVEPLASRDDIRRVRDQIRAPLLANMTEFGRTPALSLAEWREAGYELVIFPVSALRVAARAIETFYGDLRQKGHAQDMLPAMMTRAALYELIGYYDYEALDASIAKTVLDKQ